MESVKMEDEELKRKLMGLWEKTTHNTKESLGLLFDFYYNSEYIEYKERDGKVICAICGIPYSFGYGNNKLKGLYILTLTSEEGFQKRGILSELLERFNDRVKEEFDFTFLVPHTELFSDYFGTLGYLSSFYILEERYTSLHDFRNDYLLTLNDSDERIKELKKGLLDELIIEEFDPINDSFENIITFIENTERKGSSAVNLCHSSKDLEYLLCRDAIRNLSTFIAYDSDGVVVGVAFAQKEDFKRIRIVANYVSAINVYYALLDHIKHKFDEYSISVNTSDPKLQIQSMIQLNYASTNPAGSDLDNSFNSIEIPFNISKLLQPLGMVRLLRYDRLLKYIAETRSDVDFRLFIREDRTLYEVKNGSLNIRSEFDPVKDKNILELSRKEISELLLRKNDSSNIIMEAFGIPRLNLQIRLLPC